MNKEMTVNGKNYEKEREKKFTDWKIGFRSTLVHGYRRWCPVKCRII